jgi:FkbM family methyltransferase
MYLLRYLLKEPSQPFLTPNGRELLWLLARHGDAPRYQPREIRFQHATFEVPDAMSFLFQFKEIFVEEYYRFATTEPRPVIFDCGANVGTSCLYFKRLFAGAQIRAYEADATVAGYLRKNLTRNGLTDVEVVEKAVWTDDAGVEFASEGADGASVFARGEKRRVPSVRLRDELQSVPRIDLLKIDIEGAEAAVLPDCRGALQSVQHLFLEYHAYPDQAQNLGEQLAILTEAGFRYFINSAQDRLQPLVNRRYRGNQPMDLQLNIFAYRL